MGDNANHHQRLPTTLSRLAITNGLGEIVEVHGGHIVRSTIRKDHHSKVCTTKGLRDRQDRLSAHITTQFYEFQDRLSYDRPSKVVDWLIKNAKSTIDELLKLPAWKPNMAHQNAQQQHEQEQNQLVNENESLIGVHHVNVKDEMVSSSQNASTPVRSNGQILEQLGENPNHSWSEFISPSLGTNILPPLFFDQSQYFTKRGPF